MLYIKSFMRIFFPIIWRRYMRTYDSIHNHLCLFGFNPHPRSCTLSLFCKVSFQRILIIECIEYDEVHLPDFSLGQVNIKITNSFSLFNELLLIKVFFKIKYWFNNIDELYFFKKKQVLEALNDKFGIMFFKWFEISNENNVSGSDSRMQLPLLLLLLLFLKLTNGWLQACL